MACRSETALQLVLRLEVLRRLAVCGLVEREWQLLLVLLSVVALLMLRLLRLLGWLRLLLRLVGLRSEALLLVCVVDALRRLQVRGQRVLAVLLREL